MSTLKMI